MGEPHKFIRAVLVSIVEDKGYLVFRVPSLPGESVTVSRNDWTDTLVPQTGTDVVLEGLVHHRLGWRAQRARYMQPGDPV